MTSCTPGVSTWRLWPRTRTRNAARPKPRSASNSGTSGLCLLGLGREDEASRLLADVMADLDSAPAESPARWPLLAACKLWLLRSEQNRGAEAEAILDKLAPAYQFEQLAALIPAQDRETILDRYRQAGVWGTVAWSRRYDLKHIERAMRVQDLLNSDDYDRRMTKWRLIDVLRAGGDGDRAHEGGPRTPRRPRLDPRRAGGALARLRLDANQPG